MITKHNCGSTSTVTIIPALLSTCQYLDIAGYHTALPSHNRYRQSYPYTELSPMACRCMEK